MTTVAVIIPFYQKEPGILSRALESIYKQKLPEGCQLDVIIVDDGSPYPPESDVIVRVVPGVSVRIVRRRNGGPAAARNTGLDAVPPHAQFISFLDSDDSWASDHVERALASLGSENDFYFSDQQTSLFQMSSTRFEEICMNSGLTPHSETKLPSYIVSDSSGVQTVKQLSEEGSYSFNGREGLTAMIYSFLPHVSCVVVRTATLGQIRFDTDFKYAGEDYLYFLRLANSARAVCYSNHIGVIRGRGVNIFQNSVSWETRESWNILRDNLTCLLRARSILSLDRRQRAMLEQRIAFRRLEVIARALSDVRRMRIPDIHHILVADPGMGPRLASLLWEFASRKIRGLSISECSRLAELSST